MKIIHIEQLIEDPIHLLDSVVDNGDSLLIHRPKDKSVVILSMEEYNQLKACEYRAKKNEPPKANIYNYSCIEIGSLRTHFKCLTP